MLLTAVEYLEKLLSQEPARLVFALLVCELLLLLTPSTLVSAAAFLGQRLAVAALLWSTDRWPLSAALLLSAVGVLFIDVVTSFLHWRCRLPARVPSAVSASARHVWPFRACAAALATLVGYGLADTYLSGALPATAAYAVGFLLVGGFVALIVSSSSLQSVLGLLMMADAFRVVYALGKPDPLVWGLWLAADFALVVAAPALLLPRAQCV